MRSRFFRFWERVGAIAGKEVVHIRRDARTQYMAVVMPVVMLLLFGYAVSFDIDRLPLTVSDQDGSDASRTLARAFFAAKDFEEVRSVGPDEAESLFRNGTALAALIIPRGYGADLARGRPAQAQLLVDGADSVVANQVLSKAAAVTRTETQRLAGGAAFTPPLQVKVWTRFNPSGKSTHFIVPGLAAFLLAVAAVLLTALAVSGEWERGSMEQLFASPVGRVEIILGKLTPFLVLGLVQFLLVIAVGVSIFDVPIRGNPLLLFLVGLLFLIGMLGQGLLISVVAKNQQVATQAGALSALLPSMLLSGMLFPIENMPRVLQYVAVVIPARYLVHGLRGIMLKGSGIELLWRDLFALTVFATAILTLATVRFRRRVA